MPMSPRLLRPRASAALVAVDADARAYINAVRIADGGQYMEPAVQLAIDAFVTGCKADGIWTAIKASCILMGARTLSGALTPLVGTAPTNVNFVGGDYNQKTGLIGNGSSKYLDSNRNTNADPQNSVHMAAYLNAVASSSSIIIGAGLSSTGATRFGVTVSPNGATVRVRSAAFQTMTPAPALATSQSLIAVTRSSSSLTKLRVNGSESTNSSLSETPYDGDYFVFADNNNGTAVGFSNARIAYYSIGESLDLALLDSRVTTLYNAIGAAVGPNYADADVNAYINAVETADGQLLETGVRDAINTFITGCKADGIWSAIKASCILMGARTLSGALTPLVGTAPTNNNFVSGDYNRKTGLLGDGTTKFINSNRANNVSGQNDRHSSVYVTTLPASGGVVLGAGSNGTGSTNMGRGGTDGNALFVRSVPLSSTISGDPAAINSYNHSVAVNTGFWGLRRASGTEFSLRAQSVTDLVTATGAAVSGTPSSDNLFVFARNNGSGTAQAIAAARLAWYSLGDSLDLSLLDGRVTTLYNAIGAAIP